MHGLKYHFIPILLTALLLGGFFPSHAAQRIWFSDNDAFLWFAIEQHVGKADWVSCRLDLDGKFRVYRIGDTIHGILPAPEGRRILEEYEKLCTTAGEHLFPPDAILLRRGQPSLSPYFIYRSPEGKFLALEGRQNLPPPELTAFLRILWQKLITHAAQNPITAATSPAVPVAPDPRLNLR
jgi:hypothetical protein